MVKSPFARVAQPVRREDVGEQSSNVVHSQLETSHRPPAHTPILNFQETEVFDLCIETLGTADQAEWSSGQGRSHRQKVREDILRSDAVWAKITDRSEQGACEHCRKAGRACIVQMGTVGSPLHRIETSCITCKVKHHRCNLYRGASTTPTALQAAPTASSVPRKRPAPPNRDDSTSLSPPVLFSASSSASGPVTMPHLPGRSHTTSPSKPKSKRPVRKAAYKDEYPDEFDYFDYGLDFPSAPLPKLQVPHMRTVLLLQAPFDNTSWTSVRDELEKASRGDRHHGLHRHAAEMMSLIADAEVLWGVLDQSHLPDDRRCRRMDRMSLDCIVQIYRSDPSPSPTLQRGEAVTVSNCLWCRGKGDECGVGDHTPAILALMEDVDSDVASYAQHDARTARTTRSRPARRIASMARTRLKIREMNASANRIYDAAHPIIVAREDTVESASEHSVDLGTPTGAGQSEGMRGESPSVVKRAGGGKGSRGGSRKGNVVRSPGSPGDVSTAGPSGLLSTSARQSASLQQTDGPVTQASPVHANLVVASVYSPADPDRARAAKAKIIKFLHYVRAKYRIEADLGNTEAIIVKTLQTAHDAINRQILSREDVVEVYADLVKGLDVLKQELLKSHEGRCGRGLAYVLGQADRNLARWREAMDQAEGGQ